MRCRFATSESRLPKCWLGNLDRLITCRRHRSKIWPDVNEVGEIIAQSIVNFTSSEHGRATLRDLASLGLKLDSNSQENEVVGDQLLDKDIGRHWEVEQVYERGN